MKSLLLVAGMLIVCLPTWAGNAPWYRWQSRIDGRTVCAQTMSAEGWTILSGPYRDAACRKPR